MLSLVLAGLPNHLPRKLLAQLEADIRQECSLIGDAIVEEARKREYEQDEATAQEAAKKAMMQFHREVAGVSTLDCVITATQRCKVCCATGHSILKRLGKSHNMAIAHDLGLQKACDRGRDCILPVRVSIHATDIWTLAEDVYRPGYFLCPITSQLLCITLILLAGGGGSSNEELLCRDLKHIFCNLLY